jgi:hypothetical protein
MNDVIQTKPSHLVRQIKLPAETKYHLLLMALRPIAVLCPAFHISDCIRSW